MTAGAEHCERLALAAIITDMTSLGPWSRSIKRQNRQQVGGCQQLHSGMVDLARWEGTCG